MCLIGHNYENDSFFSNLSKLDVDDYVKIIKNEEEKTYKIYKKFYVHESDLSVLHESDFSEITLITCDNFSKKRLILKGK